jgi:serine protease Do
MLGAGLAAALCVLGSIAFHPSNISAQEVSSETQAETITCPGCKADRPAHHKFCTKCGTRLEAPIRRAPTFQDRLPEIRKSVVKIVAEFYDKKDPKKVRARGEFSGVVFQPGGYILTHFYPVKNADKLKVYRAFGSEALTPEWVRTDERAGVAVIKVDADIPTVRGGDSKSIKVGNTLYAVGYDAKLIGGIPAIKKGVVSALDRTGFVFQYEGFAQTDMPSRSGFYGAPVFDDEGKWIGFSAGYYDFAVGAIALLHRFRPFADTKVASDEPFEISWLGAEVAFLNESLRKKFEVEEEKASVVVRYLYPDSPAEPTLKRGDLIESVDGERVHHVHEVQDRVFLKSAGTNVSLRVHRRSGEEWKAMDVTIPVDVRPYKPKLGIFDRVQRNVGVRRATQRQRCLERRDYRARVR